MRQHKQSSDAYRIGMILIEHGGLTSEQITEELSKESLRAKQQVEICLGNMKHNYEVLVRHNKCFITKPFKTYIEQYEKNIESGLKLVKAREAAPFKPLSAKYRITGRGPRDTEYEARPLLSMEALTQKLRKP